MSRVVRERGPVFTSFPDRTVLECTQLLALPLKTVFEFFSDAHNLERITPPFLCFRILEMSTPHVEAGTVIRYRLRLHGLPLGWTSRIEVWEPPRRFVDVQVRGPYGLWRHLHEFAPEGEATRIRDRVEFRLPLGILHRTPVLSWVRRDVRAIFEYRRQAIGRLLGVPTD